MSAYPSLSDFQKYLPLARVVYSGKATQVPCEADLPLITPTRVHELLARLLSAAARGEGALALSDVALSPSESHGIQKLPELFALEGNLLLLPRYATQLRAMRAFFEGRLAQTSRRFDDNQVRTHLDALLPAETIRKEGCKSVLFDSLHQRLSIAALVDASVGVLTGGPGTGKTTTAAALLAVRRRLDPKLTSAGVLVTAPTGKAACRIGEALTRATGHLKGLEPDEKAFLRSIRCLTLHRALEWGPEAPEKGGPFRRNRLRKLEASVVLVDEASMVDLSLMHALLEALPDDASLLLLGDSDQLKSVEVGGILAELVLRSAQMRILDKETESRLCARLDLPPDGVARAFQEGLPSAGMGDAKELSGLQPLDGLSFGLKYSRRAMNAPWVLELAEIFRPETVSCIKDVRGFFASSGESQNQVRWVEAASAGECLKFCQEAWVRWMQMASGWTGLFSPESGALDEDAANGALRALGGFQLLCTTNEQVEQANAAGMRVLFGSRKPADAQLPHGCPILITANNRAMGLSNGDVGIALGTELRGPALMGLFAGSDGVPRMFTLAELPPHQPAFGLTIHKSQGSEWEHVAIQMPGQSESPLLTRNLLYTAVTRSSRKIDLFGPENALACVLEGK